jgi:predicted ester cyclase
MESLSAADYRPEHAHAREAMGPRPLRVRGITMGVEDNKALIRRFYAEIDAGNIEAMDDIVAEDYVDHHPPPFPGLGRGREGLKEAFRIFWEATPGRHEIEDQIAEGDRVVTRLTAYGRHERDLPGPLPATGAQIRETAVAIHRVADGRIVEHWSDRDDLGLMQQLGVISLPGD